MRDDVETSAGGGGVRDVKWTILRATAPLDSMRPTKSEGMATMIIREEGSTAVPVFGVMFMVDVLLPLRAEAQSRDTTARIVEGPRG